ncbi:MAG TPA: hypothetical protein VFZ40_06550 [Pyrinomonadaceae bacterium]
MREFSTPEFEQFLQQLQYYNENRFGNLSPFFDAKFLLMESSDDPPSIITFAYPETEVDRAHINQPFNWELETAINQFFSHVKDFDGRSSSAVAGAFLSALQSCIDLENSNLWEYVPDWQSTDELYDYIAFGFTYIIVNRNDARCLIVHGGYMD